jgi:hypothetical protein
MNDNVTMHVKVFVKDDVDNGDKGYRVRAEEYFIYSRDFVAKYFVYHFLFATKFSMVRGDFTKWKWHKMNVFERVDFETRSDNLG